MSNPERRRVYSQYEKQLAPFSTTLVGEFRSSAESVGDLLTAQEFKQWVEEGLELARQSWRSWEAAGEYFRVSAEMLPMLGFSQFRVWAHSGQELAKLSSALAAAYFRASPETVPQVTFPHLEEWVSQGQQLYKGTWRSASLSMQFFDGSPALFKQFTLAEGKLLVHFVDALCDRSYDLAAHCLTVAPHALTPLDKDDRVAFLRFAETMASTGWADARSYLDKGPGLLVHVQPMQRARFLSLARDLARREGRHAFSFFAEAAKALAQVDPDSHGMLISLSEDLAGRSSVAAMELLKTAPKVLERIPLETVSEWHREGSVLLDTSLEGGEAYFRLESSRGEEVLESLSSRLELSRVSDVLQMYCKALTGSEVAVHSAETLVGKGIGWVDTEVPSTEGTAIYLPAWVEDFREKEENFRVYKVYSTHQAAHLEFGTFDFQFEREGRVFPNRRRRLEKRRAKAKAKAKDGETGAREPLTDIERFFDLFPDRRLASDLFVVLEDARIDLLVVREYAGIRRSHAERQSWELEKRPAVDKLPLRQAFVENLVRASLGGLDRVVWPDSLRPLMRRAISLMKGLRRPEATVEDTAEATVRVYQLAERIPNLLPESMDDWEEMKDEAEQAKPTTSDSMGEAGDLQLPQEEEAAYQSPDSVDFRGELKPEMVQLLMRMREEREGDEAGPLSPLTPEQLKAMLEKSVEVTISDMAEADLSQLSDLLLTNLVKDMDAKEQERQQMKRPPLKDGQPVSGLSSGEDGQS
ncbi:MAG: hypothetical protein V3S01_12360, partial [Dehalococcoidia bacterium]